MIRFRVGTIGVLVACAVSGLGHMACSSSDPPPDTLCEFASDTTNCWRQLVADVSACAGDAPSGEQGTLNADNTMCTYPSGRTITFNTPLVLNGDVSDSNQDFVLTVNGTQCLHYVQTDQGMSATGSAGQVVSEDLNSATGSATITCPDGSTFRGNGLSVLQCLEASFSGLPGIYWSGTSTSQSLGLSGGADIYNCATAP